LTCCGATPGWAIETGCTPGQRASRTAERATSHPVRAAPCPSNFIVLGNQPTTHSSHPPPLALFGRVLASHHGGRLSCSSRPAFTYRHSRRLFGAAGLAYRLICCCFRRSRNSLLRVSRAIRHSPRVPTTYIRGAKSKVRLIGRPLGIFIPAFRTLVHIRHGRVIPGSGRSESLRPVPRCGVVSITLGWVAPPHVAFSVLMMRSSQHLKHGLVLDRSGADGGSPATTCSSPKSTATSTTTTLLMPPTTAAS
jgi:hypothetical protein